MRRFIFLIVVLLIGLQGISRLKDSTVHYNLPDSVKAVQFMAEVKIGVFKGKEKVYASGIKSETVSLYLNNYNKKNKIVLTPITNGIRLANGIEVQQPPKYNYVEFNYNLKIGEPYKLLIAHASDSAGDYTINSGYIFLPEEKKWKLIGTYKTKGFTKSISQPSTFHITSKRHNKNISFTSLWIQRSNGSWKNLKNESTTPPAINLYSHVDSLAQRGIEIKQIGDSISAGKASNLNQYNGIYYSMMKEGNGRQVSVTDTVVAYYKGYLFANGQVFDQTKDKPATFPLSRLIKGWQIGLPLCKVGGKIRLVIPSDLGYSIRTRAAKIPPNSILVFEIEVVDLKPLQ